ncbi:MAG: hypothetical protein IJ679_00135 [Lachnospiraceae bacterium]|nr:hypothetical protein [Lachnospiraceae bacterium]
MSRRGGLFRGRRGGFSFTQKKPVSMTSKMILASSVGSWILLLVALYYVVYTDGAYNNLWGGVGFICLYVEFVALVTSISRVRRDVEPLSARILSIAMSFFSFAAWGGIYLIGTIRG